MQAPWIFSSTFLPYTGEPIDFLLEDRSEALHGAFVNGMFHTRWADYDADRVQSWRVSRCDPPVEYLDLPNVPTAGAFRKLLRRWTVAMSGRGSAAHTPLRTHSRTAVVSTAAFPAVAKTRRNDSNQISS